MSKASEVEASIDVDEAAKKRGWSREWPDHGDETDDTGGAGHIIPVTRVSDVMVGAVNLIL